MKLVYVTESFRGKSKKTGEEQDYFVIKIGLSDNGVIVAKSQPIIWLTKEQFDKYNNI